MKKTLLLFSTLIASLTFVQAQDCSELFISEYVEGWSNNKALEIYNPTANTIDLSQYIVIRHSNGNWADNSTPEYAVQLSGMIQPFDVHVGVVDKQDPLGTGNETAVWDSLAARADGWYSPVYLTNKTWYWNGNDAVVLARGTVADIENAVYVDIFGKIGEDPGTAWSSDFPYTGAGVDVTANHSLIRKSTILKGETNPNISFFDPLAEYDSIPSNLDTLGLIDAGNWFTLGSHNCDCNWLSIDEVKVKEVEIYPNPSTGTFYLKNASVYSSIVIVNSLGQEVYSITDNNKSFVSINLNERRGVYFLKLSNVDGSTVTKKVIIR